MATAFINLSSRRVPLTGRLRREHGPFLKPGEVVEVDVETDAIGRVVGTSGPRRARKEVRQLTQFNRVHAVPWLLDRGLDAFTDKRAGAICRALGINPRRSASAALKTFVSDAVGGTIIQNTEPESVALEPEPVELSTEERRAQVAELHADHTYAELAERFGVSTTTISRDVASLEE